MRFRLDDQECRFLLRRGPAEDVVATGRHIDDHTSFERIEARRLRHGGLGHGTRGPRQGALTVHHDPAHPSFLAVPVRGHAVR